MADNNKLIKQYYWKTLDGDTPEVYEDDILGYSEIHQPNNTEQQALDNLVDHYNCYKQDSTEYILVTSYQSIY